MTGDPPRISIITPSFNQAEFLEETLRSVLDQEYPNLEYIVIDGGSTDGSVEILRKYAPRLAYWVSEKDDGHYDALNKGFARCTGDVMAWLNSDDKYTLWALSVVGEIFSTFPQIEWATSLFPLYWDAASRAVSCGQVDGYSSGGFFRGENLPRSGWYSQGSIQQESTFWRRSLWEKSGGRLDTTYSLAADFELWARFFHHAELYGIGTPLGGFRMHPAQKTSRHPDEYAAQAREAFSRHGGRPPSRLRSFFLSKLANLIRGLQRVHDRRLQPFPAAHRCLHRRREGGWRIKTP
jgi:GT2 family glycosyltransferase